MLKSYEAIYDHGRLKWIGDAPQVDNAKVIVTVLADLSSTLKQRQPPPELKGTVQIFGDLLEPAISEDEWEEGLKRTARQITGDPEAFKAEPGHAG
jgi:hypothetical protein